MPYEDERSATPTPEESKEPTRKKRYYIGCNNCIEIEGKYGKYRGCSRCAENDTCTFAPLAPQ